MIEQDFNYTDSTVRGITDFFETRVENLEPQELEKKRPTVTTTTAQKEEETKQKEKSRYRFQPKLSRRLFHRQETKI